MQTKIEVAQQIFSSAQKLAELAYRVGMREAADYLEIAAASAYEVILNEGDTDRLVAERLAAERLASDSLATGKVAGKVVNKPRRRRR